MFDLEALVLAVMEASRGSVKGRTRLVKLAYFVSDLMDLDAGFEPHFYGPYSSAITATVAGQVNRGLLDEKQETFPSRGFPGHDYAQKRYTYVLNDRGNHAAQLHRSWSPEAYDKAKSIVSTLNETGADYKVLSYAAKLRHILKQSGGTGTYDSVRSDAKELGWQMGKEEIDQAVDLLSQLGLVKAR